MRETTVESKTGKADGKAGDAKAAGEVEDAVAFAESGTWEPVEDLLRGVVAAP